MAISPNDARIFLALGDYNFGTKNYVDALANYEKVITWTKTPLPRQDWPVPRSCRKTVTRPWRPRMLRYR